MIKTLKFVILFSNRRLKPVILLSLVCTSFNRLNQLHGQSHSVPVALSNSSYTASMQAFRCPVFMRLVISNFCLTGKPHTIK